jgi:hypothetical protein
MKKTQVKFVHKNILWKDKNEGRNRSSLRNFKIIPRNLNEITPMNSISGGYMSGTSTLEVYDADILSAVSGLIVTSMQYRYKTSSATFR